MGVKGYGTTTISNVNRSAGIYTVTTAPTSGTGTISGVSYAYKISLSTALSQSGASEIFVGDTIRQGYYMYPVCYVDGSYVYCSARSSIRGEQGEIGIGISSITYYYATSTTQTAPSASSITSATIPTLSATNKYLWQKETIKLTDSSTKDTVALIAVYGDKGIGISAIKTQYYLSTSNTAQSGGSWVDTCPTYVDGRYYWTRSHITWTDKSTSTTTAVLNNALTTASKNALDALTELDNMEIGGVNYLSLKECMHTSSLTKYGITISPPDDDGWFYVSGTTTARSGDKAFDLWNPIGQYSSEYLAINHLTFEAGDIITITVETRGIVFVTGTNKTTSTCILVNGKTNDPNIYIGEFSDDVKSPITYTISTTFPYVGRIVYHYGTSAATGVTLDGSFRIKIEKGNQSTDWSPSPFDVDSDITNAQTSADQALQNTDNLGTDLSNLSDTVGNLSNDLAAKTGDLEARQQQMLQEISARYEEVRAYADGILRDYKAEVNQYMQFTSDEGLILGAKDSSFKTVHDNQGMYFKENDATVAYVTNKQLYIPDAVIENTLALGKFAFVPHNDGGVSLIWTGDE